MNFGSLVSDYFLQTALTTLDLISFLSSLCEFVLALPNHHQSSWRMERYFRFCWQQRSSMMERLTAKAHLNIFALYSTKFRRILLVTLNHSRVQVNPPPLECDEIHKVLLEFCRVKNTDRFQNELNFLLTKLVSRWFGMNL